MKTQVVYPISAASNRTYNLDLMKRSGVKVAQYSEAQAARKLGVTVFELRAMIRRHISKRPLPPDAALRPSDLIALRVLSGRPATTIQ